MSGRLDRDFGLAPGLPGRWFFKNSAFSLGVRKRCRGADCCGDALLLDGDLSLPGVSSLFGVPRDPGDGETALPYVLSPVTPEDQGDQGAIGTVTFSSANEISSSCSSCLMYGLGRTSRHRRVLLSFGLIDPVMLDLHDVVDEPSRVLGAMVDLDDALAKDFAD